MKILVTGACGFVGSTLIRHWVEQGGHEIVGLDNFLRPGSEHNRGTLRALGVSVRHADIRLASDFEGLSPVDLVVDAAANPSVLAGVDGQMSSRQLVEHNLIGTVNILEYCRAHRPILVVLSTSRVYALTPLAALPVRVVSDAFQPDPGLPYPAGLTAQGVDETFSTASPVSLYGATKLASEQLAQEYAATYDFPVWINRCGVLAGAGQFGRADQGIFAYWVNSWLRKRALHYIGFGGCGYQVRDCLHPADLARLIDTQLTTPDRSVPRVMNVSGGAASSRSLAQLSAWCRTRIGDHHVGSSGRDRRFDVPWLVLDSSLARQTLHWEPTWSTESILEDLLEHASRHPDWLQQTGHVDTSSPLTS